MLEITKEEANIIRKVNNDIKIFQTMKSKRHRGKYFIEENPKIITFLTTINNSKIKF